MQVNEKQLKQLVREAVRQKLNRMLGESADYTAQSITSLKAQEVGFQLEQEIIKSLNLIGPDHMQDPVRERYSQIISNMKASIEEAVSEAVRALAPFPRINNGR